MTSSSFPHEPDRDRSELKLERELLQQLSRPAPWPLLLHTLLEWALIIGAISLSLWADSGWISLLAIVFVATRQHALLVFMHEFAHRQFSRTRPVLNDVIGDFLTALPMMVTVHGFRRDHFQHHRATSTKDDPNWASTRRRNRYRFPRSRIGMIWLLLLHTVGFYTPQELKSVLFDAGMATASPRDVALRQAGFWVSVLGACWAFNLWLIVAFYWFLPMFTVLMAVLYLREVAEHHAMPKRGLEAARTMLSGPVESFLIGPHSVGFHAEHHLYPSVPFCRLPQLHRLLSERAGYAKHAVVTRGYFTGLLREASSRP